MQEITEASKIILGTAQLGQTYGIANKSGKPSSDIAFEILKTAHDLGIDTIDTAPQSLYGESEALIGNYLSKTKLSIKVITKIPKFPGGNKFIDFLNSSLVQSISALRVKKIHGILMHNFDDFNRNRSQCLEFFRDIKMRGLVGITGISVYSSDEIMSCIDEEGIDCFQAPFNIWDTKLLSSGTYDKLLKNGQRLFSRSIYLQGMLLLSNNELMAKYPSAAEYHEKLAALSKIYGLPINKIAFCFVRDALKRSSMVVGAETPDQVKENVALLKEPPLPKALIMNIMETFKNMPAHIINPSLWRLNQ